MSTYAHVVRDFVVLVPYCTSLPLQHESRWGYGLRATPTTPSCALLTQSCVICCQRSPACGEACMSTWPQVSFIEGYRYVVGSYPWYPATNWAPRLRLNHEDTEASLLYSRVFRIPTQNKIESVGGRGQDSDFGLQFSPAPLGANPGRTGVHKCLWVFP